MEHVLGICLFGVRCEERRRLFGQLDDGDTAFTGGRFYPVGHAAAAPMNGQLAPDSGDIRLGENSLVGLAPHRIWRLGVGRTFQVTATFGSMGVRENLQAALLSHHRRT